MFTALIIITLLILSFLAAAALCGLSDIHFHGKGKPGQSRVACVGDSITNGALIPGCFFRSYPAVLGRLLGKAYHVENYGLNGRTLSDGADRPYTKESEYEKSKAFDPEIVILMLGTNDTKPCNWQNAEEMAHAYDVMIPRYTGMKKPPRVLLCTPTWAVNARNRLQYITNDTEAALLPEVAAQAREAAKRHQIGLIDLYTLFEGKLEWLSYDGIHPNARGAKIIATEVARMIRMQK